jgi:hypothetical protein
MIAVLRASTWAALLSTCRALQESREELITDVDELKKKISGDSKL